MPKREIMIVVGVLLAAVVLCYAGVLSAGFIWDDDFLVVNNPLVRAPLTSFAPFYQDIVNSGFAATIYYRPVQIFSYAIDYGLWGMNPLAFHASNVLLHFFNALLVFALTLRLTRNKACSLLAAVLFAVHPAHAGAVSYISGRAELLFFFFGFIYMMLFSRFMERRSYLILAASLASFVLALLSKEGALIFPALLILADAIVYRRRAKDFAWHLPAVALLAAYILVHHMAFSSRYSAVMKPSDLAANAWNFILMLGHFLALGVFPVGLHMRGTVSDKIIFAAPAVAAACLAAAVIFKEKRRSLFFAAVFFCAALLPYILVVGYFGVFAEHWMYLASYGLFLFMAVAITELYARAKGLAKGVVAAVLFIAVVFYSFTTAAQNSHWRGSVALSDRVLSASGGDATAMHFKAVTLIKEGRPEEAKEAIKSYTDESPKDPRSWYIKGRMLLAVDDKIGAAECFKKTVEVDPSYEDGYFGLALTALADGDKDKGLILLEKTVRMNPSNSEALLFLGTIYSETGDNAKALEYTRKALAVNPYDYNALVNMGTVYSRMGNAKEGATYYLKAADLYPEKPVPCYNLGNIFYLSGQKNEAAIWLKKAIKADPEFKPALELIRKMSEE